MNDIYDLHSLALIAGRTPAFPIEIALDVMGAPDPLAATAAVYRERAGMRAALFAATPSLARAVDEWIDGKPLRSPKTPLRALAYLLRMCARPTPFGLCSGIGRVAVGESTTLALGDESQWRTSTRPDMGLMRKLASSFERSEARGGVAYVANECVIERGDRLFVTSVALANRETSGGAASSKQRAVNLKNTEAVAVVRAFCTSPKSLQQIAQLLAERFGAPVPDALKLLDQLISAGLLISELVPSHMGDPSRYLLERFDALGAPGVRDLRDAAEAAAALDEKPLNERSPRDYAALYERFAALLPESPDTPVQTDLRVAFTGTLGANVLGEVERFAGISARLGNVTTLQRLHDAFVERYEGVERLVPLLELVDENLGIRVPEKLDLQERDTSARDALLMRIACDAQRDGSLEIVLDEAMLDVIAPPVPPDHAPLSSMEIGFAVAAQDARAVESGDFMIVPAGYMFSDTANKSLGRFAHLVDDETLARMNAIAREGEAPGTVTAELTFLPLDERSYNVTTRPRLYEYELRLGIGQPAAGNSLDPRDLWVGIDGDRFYLWSKSLNARVDIRETHAFATAFQAPDLCRLLAFLRYDRTRLLDRFDWGTAAGCTYLPRIRIGRVVLAPRTWNFEPSTFDLQRERARWNLPRYAYLTDDDRRLLIDLDSSVAADLIADQAAQRTRLELIEALPLPDCEWVRGTGGGHVVEFVAQGLCARPAAAALAVSAPTIVTERVVHGPGSAWTYAKLYCGKQTATHLLLTRVAPLVEALRSEGAIDRWFFVRYGDPHDHLRLRFRAAGAQGGVRERVARETEAWLQDGTLSRVVFDTYAPEYERYGGAEAIDASEAFFTADSDVLLEMLARGPRGTDDLVAMAAASFDPYLCSEEMTTLALHALADLAKQKLAACDREVLKQVQPAQPAPYGSTAFERAVEGDDAKKRLADLIHMHCNRAGVDGEAEARVYALLRALALRRVARKKQRDPEFSGSRS